MDEGVGSCLFKESSNREILESVLKFDEGKGCEHHAWVIMTNHVHLLFNTFCPTGISHPSVEIHLIKTDW
ncbi:MAG: hypothetical protein EOP84_23030 [Verrucomicrobiaceae bacterium]|nr:MAG: hypothetical protein EOP84_23030 [Verrucomicrobiaceae bacterium]